MKRVLIANRGEIACRIIRTAKCMGLETVAVYSEVDRMMPHVLMSDFAYCLGENESSKSYLSISKILSACKALSVDAVHPGYGFLSENADFAKTLEQEGITFIGPTSESIEVMGSKILSKKAVSEYGVPLIPGSKGKVGSEEEAVTIANKVGFPLMIKASAGGGGKGMRIVYAEHELIEAFRRAKSEAQNAFGNDDVFMEKYIQNPKHIEVQILADKHGHIISLLERECSIQRRHQKLIEEAPSIALSDEVRKTMFQAAINVAKSCSYVGAGTVEFIVDENQHFYFLEMNTRLQVEHPVTEMISGIDLVEQQIRIANGAHLGISQKDVQAQGHAIELRIYAEDVFSNFSPNIGEITSYSPPSGEGIRVDDGIYSGMKIPIYYDSMLAKLIVHAPNRHLAVKKMRQAIRDYEIGGIKTTLPFGQFVFNHRVFLDGTFTTNFVQEYFSKESYMQQHNDLFEVAAEFVKFHQAQRYPNG